MLTTMLYILFPHFGDYIKNSSLFNFVNVYPLYDSKIIIIITFLKQTIASFSFLVLIIYSRK